MAADIHGGSYYRGRYYDPSAGRFISEGAGRWSVARSSSEWSYRKLVLWWVLALLSTNWIAFYVNAVDKNSSAVLSATLVLSRGYPSSSRSEDTTKFLFPLLKSRQ